MGKNRSRLERKKVEAPHGPAKFIKIIGEERGENSSGGEVSTAHAFQMELKAEHIQNYPI